MKIHTVELRHVRQIEALTLDLSAPLTVIGGPNGVGKTTLQQAILAAMFYTSKDMRESFVSEFDPDSPPTVVLGLSRGEPAPTIFLTRNLSDDKGEWKEGATILKRKRQALDKIQEVLPISADAAALLLWGRQDDLAAVVESFPSDGHSLLTAATIKGSGPDPKQIIKDLEKDIDNARKGERGGQIVGPLMQARNKLKDLEEEWEHAALADEELRTRRSQLDEAKKNRDLIKSQARDLEAQVTGLAQLEKLLTPALRDLSTRDEMVEKQGEWDGLEEEINNARKELADHKQELAQLRTQHRVARDEELAGKIEEVAARIEAGEELEAACADLDKDLKAKKRPDAADVKALQKLQARIKEANDKMEATGVRYELAADRGPRTLRIAEDGQAEKEITLTAGQIHQGIVGRLTIEAEGLRFSAAGKEDISGFKEAVRKAVQETAALFKKFDVDDETAFLDGAKEKEEKQQALQGKRNDMKVQLRGATVAALKDDRDRVLAGRAENKMTLEDKEACAGKRLPPAVEINNWCLQKSGAIGQAAENLAALEEKRPNPATRDLHRKTLDTIQKKARESAAAFTDADELQRPPTKEAQEKIRASLEKKRQEQAKLGETLVSAETLVAELSGQLKQAQPHRPLNDLSEELQEAKETFNREQVVQEARALLKERIEEKMATLAAHVPVELGKQVSHHLGRLTGSPVGQVALSQELAISQVGENGAAKSWRTQQLSHGERHQAALAVKIAVARALAETSGPVFIMLDDSLVAFDPHRRAATEEFLLDLVADEKLQVILLTCHTDWASAWKARRPDQVNYIELVKTARYYRPPPAAAWLAEALAR